MPYQFETPKDDKPTIKTGFYTVRIIEAENPSMGTYGEQLYLKVACISPAIEIRKWIKTEFKWKIRNLIKAFKMEAEVTESIVDGKEVETYTIDFPKQIQKTALALIYTNAKGYADIFDFVSEDETEERKNAIFASYIAYRDNGFKFKKKGEPVKPTEDKKDTPF